MKEIPWGTVIIFTILILICILAFADGLIRQSNMQKEIADVKATQQEIRDAIKSVSAKAKERLANIEGMLENCPSCSMANRRVAERRKPDADWGKDSDFTKGIIK